MADAQIILSDQSILTTASTLDSQNTQEQQQPQRQEQEQPQQQQEQGQREQQQGNDSPTTISIERKKSGDEKKEKKKEEKEEKKQQKEDEPKKSNDNKKNNNNNNNNNGGGGGGNGGDGGDGGDGGNGGNNDAKKEEEQSPEKEKERDRVIKKFEKAQDTIIGAVEDQDGFDVYQMCAFLSKQARFLPLEIMSVIQEENAEDEQSAAKDSDRVHKDKRGRTISRHSTAALARRIPVDQRVSKLQYYLCIIRAASVAVLQIWSLALTIQELIDQADICRGTFDIYSFEKASSKIIYAGYVALIGINVLTWINGVRTSGMYSSLVDNECILPDLVDQGWLIAGRTVNYLVLIFAIWASFLIIYLSETVLDMILNSIAIYFVLELDNMVMSPRDYKQVAAYIDAYQWDLNERVDEYINRKEQPMTQETRECNLFKMLFDVGAWLISAAVVTPVIYFTAFVAFCVAPVYFVVCL